jgi:PAS domain S-box-containing protein
MPSRKNKTGKSLSSANERLEKLERENEALKTEIAHHHEVHETLASERDKLRSLVDGLGRTEVGIDIIGIDHKIHFQNRVLEERFGVLDGKPCHVKYMGAETPCPDCPMTSAINLNRLESRQLLGQDGRDYRVLSAPFANPDGTVDRVIEVIIDTTERRQTDGMLQESERMFRSLVENSHSGIFIVADDFRFAYANEMFCKIIGYPHTEVIGLDFRSVLDDESKNLVAERYVKRQKGESIPSRYEFNIVRKDGEKRRVEISSTVVLDAAGKPRTLAQILDITERKKAEEELRESERKFAGIVKNIPGVVFEFRVRKDGTSYFSYVSPRATDLFGLPSDPSSPEWNADLGARVHPDDRQRFFKSIAGAVASRSEWNFEGRVTMPAGGPKWFQGISYPTRIGDELVFDGVLLDVSKRRAAEEELQEAHAELENRVEQRTAELQKANDLLLQEMRQREVAEEKRRESETKYRDLVENANSIILELDTKGRVTFFNPFAQQFFGFTEQEIVGRPVVGTIVPKTDSQGNDLRTKIKELVRYPERFHNSENENIRRNGEKVWIAWTNRGLYDKKGRLKEVLCIGIDQTEQKRTAEMLAQQEMEKAAVAERQRLARDLHDAVTQTLFSASLVAAALPKVWAKDPAEGQRCLEELRQLTRGALAEMRMLLLELRPTALTEVGLVDLLRQLTEAAAGRGGFPVSYKVDGKCTVPPDVQVALYRVAQEALNNVLKHSGASEAAVSLLCQADSALLTISDNGAGFDPETVSPKHLGLRIMQERAAGVGAAVKVTSSEGRGTEIAVAWPDASRREYT